MRRVADLHELLDSIPNLLVENPAVGDYNNGIQHRATVLFKPNQLMSKPSVELDLPLPALC